MKTASTNKKTFQISEEEWKEIEHRFERAKKNLKSLKTWKELKQKLLSSKSR